MRYCFGENISVYESTGDSMVDVLRDLTDGLAEVLEGHELLTINTSYYVEERLHIATAYVHK